VAVHMQETVKQAPPGNHRHELGRVAYRSHLKHSDTQRCASQIRLSIHVTGNLTEYYELYLSIVFFKLCSEGRLSYHLYLNTYVTVWFLHSAVSYDPVYSGTELGLIPVAGTYIPKKLRHTSSLHL
jgi:hypothetical protein